MKRLVSALLLLPLAAAVPAEPGHELEIPVEAGVTAVQLRGPGCPLPACPPAMVLHPQDGAVRFLVPPVPGLWSLTARPTGAPLGTLEVPVVPVEPLQPPSGTTVFDRVEVTLPRPPAAVWIERDHVLTQVEPSQSVPVESPGFVGVLALFPDGSVGGTWVNVLPRADRLVPILSAADTGAGRLLLQVEDDHGIVSADVTVDGEVVARRGWSAPVRTAILEVPLPPGTHRARVTAYDWGGHTASVEALVEIPSPPELGDERAPPAPPAAAPSPVATVVTGPDQVRAHAVTRLSQPVLVVVPDGSALELEASRVVLAGSWGAMVVFHPAAAARVSDDRLLLHPGADTTVINALPGSVLHRVFLQASPSVVRFGATDWVDPSVTLDADAGGFRAILPTHVEPLLVLPAPQEQAEGLQVVANGEALQPRPLEALLKGAGPGYAVAEQDGQAALVMMMPGPGSYEVQFERASRIAFLTPGLVLVALLLVAGAAYLVYRP